MGLYWRIEKTIREMESASGSVVGATGALYAVRRNLLVAVPAGTILDDVYIPMNVVRQEARVIFVPSARAWDVAPQKTGHEFSRKVRTLSGNYQLVQLAPWLLSGKNPLRFEFISHKLLRLFAPFALAAAFVASLWLRATVLPGRARAATGILRIEPDRNAEAGQRAAGPRRRRCGNFRGPQFRGPSRFRKIRDRTPRRLGALNQPRQTDDSVNQNPRQQTHTQAKVRLRVPCPRTPGNDSLATRPPARPI